jgi:oligopeptide transport system permease protein
MSAQGSELWRALRGRRAMAIAAAVVILVVLACAVGPWIAAQFGLDGTRIDTDLGAAPPSVRHWFGTDTLGRDLLVRVLIGGRIALVVAVVATAVALVIGVAYGAAAAYAGGWIDDAMMRVVDAMYGIPTVAFVVVVMAVLGTRSPGTLFALIGAISWLTMARIVRGQVRGLRDGELVAAARAIGASPVRIVVRHILPNTVGPVIVYATLTLPNVMLTEAFLSYLGLGVQAPLASWGTLVTEGSSQALAYPWMLLGPGIAMAVTVTALNVLGDGVRDALDARMRND